MTGKTRTDKIPNSFLFSQYFHSDTGRVIILGMTRCKSRFRSCYPLVAAFLLCVAPAFAKAQPDLRGLAVGQALPDVPRTLEGPGGTAITFPASGLTAVLFWSTWSPRSEEAILFLQKESERLAGKGMGFLLVNAENQKMTSGDLSNAEDYLAERKVTLPLAFDRDLSLYNEIGVIALPTTLFFREDGTLADYYSGFPSNARDEIPEKADRLLGLAPPPGQEERPPTLYIPKDNAMLYFGMGKVLKERGMPEKAKERLAESLRRDGSYPEPLELLEQIFYKGEEPTPERKAALRKFLEDSGLPGLAARY